MTEMHCPYVYLPFVRLSVRMPVCQPVGLSSVRVFVSPSVCPSVSLSVRPSVCPYVRLCFV